MLGLIIILFLAYVFVYLPVYLLVKGIIDG